MFEAIDFKKSLKLRKVIWLDNSFSGRHFLPIYLFSLTIFLFYYGLKQNEILIFKITAIFFTLVLYTIYAIHKNAKLIEVPVNHAPLRFRKILENGIINSGRRMARSNQQYLTALKSGGSMFGNRITVLYDKKSIFINVQNFQWNGYFPFSFGKNKRVAKKFIQIIKDADQALSS